MGKGTGKRVINPRTFVDIGEGGYLEMDTTQIKGVDSTNRVTRGVLGENAKLVIKEKIMTDGEQTAQTNFEVDLNGMVRRRPDFPVGCQRPFQAGVSLQDQWEHQLFGPFRV